MKPKKINELGMHISQRCDWNGKHITQVYLQALTDANFHELRKEVARLVNKELGCKLRVAG